MTTQEVAKAVDADEYTKGYELVARECRTIADAENAVVESPLTDAIRTHQEKWEKFWSKRGTAVEDHDCGTEMGDGWQVCFQNQETAH